MTVQPKNHVAEQLVVIEEPVPALRVEKVDATVEVKKLVTLWYKIAQERYESFYSIEWRNKEKVALADTSKRVIFEIKKQLNKDMSGTSVYLAYNEKNKIEGIALAKIQQNGSCLECLATHPKNVPLFEGEKPRKGVGTALLTRVITDVYKVNRGDLGLYAEPTAVSFYEKHGFVIKKDVPKKLTMPYLALTHEDMKKGEILERSSR